MKNRKLAALMDKLEDRRLLSTPSSPRPESLASFDRGERQFILDRFTNMPSSDRADLQSKMPSSGNAIGAFDADLLDYMVNRTTAQYFFRPSDTANRASFINTKLSTTNQLARGNDVVDSRLFPEANNSGTYTVNLAGDINWITPGTGDDNFLQTLNQFTTWTNLVEAYRTSGDAKYADEMMYQLADWSSQFESITVPGSWTNNQKSGWDLTTSLRTESMTNAYYTLLGSGAFSATDNALLLYKLVQHGDFLYSQAQSATIEVDGNRTTSLAKSLHMLAVTLPELNTSAAWEAKARDLLTRGTEAQIYSDGGHIEQSPGYQLGVLNSLLEAYWLDQLNGNASQWSSTLIDEVENSVDSYRQLLSPDGKRAAIGDTYRITSVTSFLKSGLILDKINTTSTLVDGTYGPGDTQFKVDSVSNIHVGDLLNASNKSELMRVTGVNSGTRYVTVQKGVAGTGPLSLNDNVTLYNLGDQPIAKPRARDVWLFGTSAMTPFLNVPATPAGALGDRGKAYAMPESGNYVMRSDQSESATQLIFDAGPKGGYHGHYDPLNFELWSGGRPLILDPGAYKYDDSADRNYVISTKAHNTINVDGQNVGQMNDPDGTGPLPNWSVGSSHVFGGSSGIVSGWHQGYSYLDGQPTVSRSIWYNYDGTAVIVDWVEGTQAHNYSQSFNLPAGTEANTTGHDTGTFKTRYSTGDNVAVTPIAGGDKARISTFTTSDPSGDYKDDAYRFTVTKNGQTFAVFVTLVQAYSGLSTPAVSASFSGGTQPGQNVAVTLSGAVGTVINFTAPNLPRVGVDGNTNGDFNDVEFDAQGNLHYAWLSREDRHLKYSVRDRNTGKWSVVQTVDGSADYVGQFLDLKINPNTDRPGIAYFNGYGGDLKYALLGDTNVWEIQTIESQGSTGLYPSLMYTRSGGSAVISYYNRTRKELKVAEQSDDTEWNIKSLTTGGDQGRFSQIRLDPNRSELNNRYVVAWEDSLNGKYKYGYTDGTFKTETIADSTMTVAGGYLSLDFEDSGSGTIVGPGASNFRFVPRVAYYESQPDTSLKFAKRDKVGNWTVERVDGQGTARKAGLYAKLIYNAQNRPEIFYYDSKADTQKRVIGNGTGGWLYSVATTGGRETHLARYNGLIAATTLDEANSELRVEFY